MMSSSGEPAQWQRLLAYWWYAWGQSVCHAGNRTAEQAFYRHGVRSFARATRLWPDFAPAYYWSGLIRGRELSEYSAAVADLGRAIALRPEWPEPYLQRGLFHRFNGAPAAALSDLQRYLELGGDPYWRSEAARHIQQLQVELEEHEEPGTENREPGTANREPGTANREPGTEDREPGTENREPGTKNREPGTENREPGS